MADYRLPEELRYSEQDEWARREDDGTVTVGVTDYAQQQLGDVVFVELPEVGRTVRRGEPFGVIESVKAVSDLFAPLSGEVVAVNEELSDHPERVNEDCYGAGWMIRLRPGDPAEWDALLDADAYRKHIEARSKD